jgi:hypothetical protein
LRSRLWEGSLVEIAEWHFAPKNQIVYRNIGAPSMSNLRLALPSFLLLTLVSIGVGSNTGSARAHTVPGASIVTGSAAEAQWQAAKNDTKSKTETKAKKEAKNKKGENGKGQEQREEAWDKGKGEGHSWGKGHGKGKPDKD